MSELHARGRRAASILVLLGAAGALLWSPPAAAQGYALATGSTSFTSISGSGTPLGLSSQDDTAASFSAPFAFPLFGTTVSAGTTLYVSSNGTISVGASYYDLSNTSFPSGVAGVMLLAPFWDDLIFGSLGDAYWAQIGSGASAELVVEWSNVNSYAASADSISFQARIGANGTVRYAYGPRSVVGSWNGASIGLEDPTAFVGAEATCTPTCVPSSVPQGTLLTFTPQGTAQTADLTVSSGTSIPTTIAGGTNVQVDYTVRNGGGAASGSTRLGLFVGTSSPPSDFEVTNASVPGISAGGSTSGVLTFTVPPVPGTYYVGLTVDPSGLVSEASESNNTYVLGQLTVTGGGGGSITVTTTEAPRATLGVPYDLALQQVGASSPAWRLSSGSLPPGLSVSTGGRITGTPAEEGAFSFTVEASESGLLPGQRALSIEVLNGGSGSITVQPSTLPQATVGAPYSASLTASGGTAPYAFQIISGRPDWLTMDSQGRLSGTPDAAGQHTMTISVFDNALVDSIAIVSLDVISSGPLTLAASVPAGVAQRPYSQRVVEGGRPPYQVNVLDGSFPDGMAISAEGFLAGTPTRAGSWSVTVQINDSNSPAGTAAGQVVLRVTELRELSIAFTELAVNLRTDLDVALAADGGVPPYTWSLAQGALQSGLSLIPEGRIVGRVEQASTATVTFSVRDNEGTTATREVYVVARGYRGGGGGGSSGGRGGGGGCACLRPRDEAGLGALLAVGLLVLWRRRRGFDSNAA
jgi:hypothetical protein